MKIGAKAAHKMLVKLTTVVDFNKICAPRGKNLQHDVNFTNILRAVFVPIILHQKSRNLKFKFKKAARETFVGKSCVQNVGEIELCCFKSLHTRLLQGKR
jgi:hypothetical protein